MAETRRRGTELEDAILDAAWSELVERGYSGLTFESIAARAQTGKHVLYRRWPTKEQLLLATLARRRALTPVLLTPNGTLRDDVLYLLRSSNKRFGGEMAGVFSTVLAAYFEETQTTIGELRAMVFGDRPSAMNTVIANAIARGELPEDGLPPRIAALPFDLFRHDLLMTLHDVPDENIVEIVDTIFMPLVRDWISQQP